MLFTSNSFILSRRKLAAKKIVTQVASARVTEDNLALEISSAQDEKGRALYGNAWDEPTDGGVPIKVCAMIIS